MPELRWARLPRLAGLVLLPVVAGLLQAWAIAEPWDGGAPNGWLQLASLAILAWLLECDAQTAGRGQSAALTGWLYATTWLAGSFWWMFIAMSRYGGLPAPLAATAVLILSGVLAFYYAAACALYQRYAERVAVHRFVLRALFFAALWLLAELARGCWFTGFGWSGGGYAHVQGPLAAYAPWVGVYGITAVAAWLAMMLALICNAILVPSSRATLFRWQSGARVLLVCVVLFLPAALQWVRPLEGFSAGTVKVTLLQGNIPQDEKFQVGSGIPLALRWYGEQLLYRHDASLVVAPETALPLLPQTLPPGYWDALEARYTQKGGQAAALIGLPWGNATEGYTNAAIGLAPEAARYHYDKHHLVPFGEFIPPGFRWFTDMMQIPLGDFNRGGLNQPSFEWQGQRLAVNICYEDLFGEELGARFADVDAAPTVFVNLSNIAWFGDTVAIAQHLNISRMRALEFARPMVRATNTGATAWIDHRGQVRAQLAPHTRGALTVEVEGRTGRTPYARWVADFGLWPLWLLSLGVLLWVVWCGRPSAARSPGVAP